VSPVSPPSFVVVQSELADREPTGSASASLDSKASAAHRATAVIGVMAVASATPRATADDGIRVSSSLLRHHRGHRQPRGLARHVVILGAPYHGL
jgi:hypothetical protein